MAQEPEKATIDLQLVQDDVRPVCGAQGDPGYPVLTSNMIFPP